MVNPTELLVVFLVGLVGGVLGTFLFMIVIALFTWIGERGR